MGMIALITVLRITHLFANTESAKVNENVLNGDFSHFKVESMMESYSERFLKEQRAPPSHQHTVVFAIKKLHMDELRVKLEDISDPFSPNYGKHLTRVQITNMTSNFEGRSKLLLFLENHSRRYKETVNIVKVTPYSDFVFAEASVKLWESFFDTEFFFFRMKNQKNRIPADEGDILVIVRWCFPYSVVLLQHE